jgi:DNA helicase INO80
MYRHEEGARREGDVNANGNGSRNNTTTTTTPSYSAPSPTQPGSNATTPYSPPKPPHHQFNNPYPPPTPAPAGAASHIPGPPASPRALTTPSSYQIDRERARERDYQQPAPPRDKPTSNYYDPTSDSSERRPSESAAWKEGQTQTPQVRIPSRDRSCSSQ